MVKRLGFYALSVIIVVAILLASLIWSHNQLTIHRRLQQEDMGRQLGESIKNSAAAMRQMGNNEVPENPTMLDNYPSGLTLQLISDAAELLFEEMQWTARISTDYFLISNSLILLVLLILLYEIRQLARRLPPPAQ